MPVESRDGFLGLQVPQFDRLVIATRSQSLAIWTKSDAIDRKAIAGEGSDEFLGLRVPQFDGAVIASRSQSLAI